tara:strand:+ start:135 stop:737 length:603 start_codon:yes stop_codon:yes gene_type:complete
MSERVLVIGNGSSTKEFELGNKIDEFDIVVRFNRGYFEGVNKFEKYVGSKTNILIVHDGFAKPERLTDDVLESVDKVLIVIPKFKFNGDLVKDYGWGDKVQVIPVDYEVRLNGLHDFKNRWPTTGLVGLYFICDNYDDVTIYGFDGSDEKYKYYHYFAKEDGRTTEFMNRPNRVDHDKDIERKCINEIKEVYNLKDLRDE